MASVRKYTLTDGTVKYQADIVIKKDGAIIHRESKTFDKQKLAKDWGMRREVELQQTEVYKKRDFLPLSDVIKQYLKEFAPEGRSKLFDISKLLKRDIASRNVHTLTAKDLIAHVRERNKECTPQTAQNDLIWIGVVLRTMRGVIEIDCPQAIVDTARQVLKAEGLVAKAAHRERRPTRKELWALSRHFHGHPMLHVMWFAIYSARRQAEITKLEWADIDHDKRTCAVNNLKDPRRKGIKKRFKLPRNAYKIILRQPKQSKYIFPYNAKSISTTFTRACHILGIDGLHFHDLRHEATSRLFEKGLSIQQVQQITLHSTWATLQRYCNTDPGDIDV